MTGAPNGLRLVPEGVLPEWDMPRKGYAGTGTAKPSRERSGNGVHYPDTCTPFGPQARQGETAERKYGVLFRDALFARKCTIAP